MLSHTFIVFLILECYTFCNLVYYMHPRTITKTKEITKTILELLAVTGGLTVLALLGEGRQSPQLLRVLGKYSTVRIRETVKRFRMQKYIQYDMDDETAPIVLTKKGMARFSHHRLREVFAHKKKWDYLWRMVIFDIPEKRKHLRELFRRELQQAGFYRLQRSIFVSPFACEKDIENLCAWWEIERYALVFVVASLGSAEKRVREYFFEKEYR